MMTRRRRRRDTTKPVREMTDAEFDNAWRKKVLERKRLLRKKKSSSRGNASFALRHGKVYADAAVKKNPNYRKAVRLEQDLFRRYPGLLSRPIPASARHEVERVAKAFERAHFYGWAENYRRHLQQRDPRLLRSAKRHAAALDAHARSARDKARHHRSASAPSFAKQPQISKKIRLLREEGYGPKQAAAIAYRMAGIPARTKAERRGSSRDKRKPLRLRVERGAIGNAKWSLPSAPGYALYWNGPGARLRLLLPSGSLTTIEHHTADGNYTTFKEANAAAHRFARTES